MKQFIIPVNNEALYCALVGIVGVEGATQVFKAYKIIDEAMAFAFEQGRQDPDTGQANFKAGYQHAERDAASDAAVLNQDQLQFEFDEGYLAGVDDARRDPAEADRYVADILQQDAFDDAEPILLTDQSNPVCTRRMSEED